MKSPSFRHCQDCFLNREKGGKGKQAFVRRFLSFDVSRAVRIARFESVSDTQPHRAIHGHYKLHNYYQAGISRKPTQFPEPPGPPVGKQDVGKYALSYAAEVLSIKLALHVLLCPRVVLKPMFFSRWFLFGYPQKMLGRSVVSHVSSLFCLFRKSCVCTPPHASHQCFLSRKLKSWNFCKPHTRLYILGRQSHALA